MTSYKKLHPQVSANELTEVSNCKVCDFQARKDLHIDLTQLITMKYLTGDSYSYFIWWDVTGKILIVLTNRALAKDWHKTQMEFISVSENHYRHQYAHLQGRF